MMTLTDPFLGQRIREYKILEIVGGGGMGTVYKARHVYLFRDRAIKVIKPNHERDFSFIERFKREARILSELNHPNVVHLFEFGQLEENVFFMVLEYITGKSVASRMKELGRVPLADAIRITRQAALGLACAHENGIIHRDISPENLMLVRNKSGQDIIKVIDFGIAKPVVSNDGVTDTNILIGKPEYMSPEQCGILDANETVDFRTDIYSLAVTLYHLIAGRLPFVSTTPQGYILKHATEPPIPITSHFEQGQIPSELDALLKKALSKKPYERHSSMNQFINDLDDILALGSQQVTVPCRMNGSMKTTPNERKLEEPSDQAGMSTSASTTGTRFKLVWKVAAYLFVFSSSAWLMVTMFAPKSVSVQKPQITQAKPVPPAPPTEPRPSDKEVLAKPQHTEQIRPKDPEEPILSQIEKQEQPLTDQRKMILLKSLNHIGETHYANGKFEMARSTYIKLFKLEPGYRIKEFSNSESLIKFVEKIKRENVGVIVLTLNPPDATITIDGKKVETTRRTVAVHIFKGGHTLKAEKAGFIPQVQTISVAPGETKKYFFSLRSNSNR